MSRFHAILLSLFCGLLMCIPVIFCDPAAAESPVIEEAPAEEDAEQSDPVVMHLIDDCVLVAYCPCYDCSGGWGKSTASGEIATEGVTVAVDDSIIPFGSSVVIDGHRYKAQDTGAFSGKVVDIYFDNHKAVLDFGRKVADVYWIEEEQ